MLGRRPGRRHHLPGQSCPRGEEGTAESFAEELGKESEDDDPHVPFRVRFKLQESGDLITNASNPSPHFRTRQLVFPLLIRPRRTTSPTDRGSDTNVDIAKEGRPIWTNFFEIYRSRSGAPGGKLIW